MMTDELVAWARSDVIAKLGATRPRRCRHVLGVGDRAASAGVLFSINDRSVLHAAALLHDVGYAPELVDSGFHPLDGAHYLMDVQAPERVASLVARHSCAHREAELRGLSTQLAAFPDEATAVRDALWWADMTTSPDGEVVTVEDRLAEIQKRYGPTDLVTLFVQAARDDLIGAVRRTEDRLTAARIIHEK